MIPITDIRKEWLNYYKSLGYKVISSAPLLHPLFPMSFNMSAGLVQLDPLIRGITSVKNDKMVIIQNCFRHFDLNLIGDPTHLSFFQMGGAFEVKNFNKFDILNKIFIFLTKNIQLNKDRIYGTVLWENDSMGFWQKDKESFEFWSEVLPKENIVLGSLSENLWQQGGGSTIAVEKRLCGISSEIYYDLLKPACGPNCKPGCNCGKFLELSNNLFITHQTDVFSKKVTPLKIPAAESVIGIERVAMACENLNSIYQTFYFPKINTNPDDTTDNKEVRIVLDHLKAFLFLVSEGAPGPGRNGRARIVRRLIREIISGCIILNLDLNLCIEETFNKLNLIYPHIKNFLKSKELAQKIINDQNVIFTKTLQKAIIKINKYKLQNGLSKVARKDSEFFRKEFGIPINIQNHYILKDII